MNIKQDYNVCNSDTERNRMLLKNNLANVLEKKNIKMLLHSPLAIKASFCHLSRAIVRSPPNKEQKGNKSYNCANISHKNSKKWERLAAPRYVAIFIVDRPYCMHCINSQVWPRLIVCLFIQRWCQHNNILNHFFIADFFPLTNRKAYVRRWKNNYTYCKTKIRLYFLNLIPVAKIRCPGGNKLKARPSVKPVNAIESSSTLLFNYLLFKSLVRFKKKNQRIFSAKTHHQVI